MFVRDFFHVQRPFEAVAPRFVKDARWLDPSVGDAIHEAVALARILGRASGASDSGTSPSAERFGRAHVDRGELRTRANGLVLPIQWSNQFEPSWFPALECDLEIAPMGSSASELVLNASFDTKIDIVLAQRVVEMGVRAFLRNVAIVLESATRGTPPP